MSTTIPNTDIQPDGTRTSDGDFRLWKLCAWAGPVFILSVVVAWAGIAGFIPPPRENWSADRISDFYRSNEVSIRIGMEGVILFAMLYFLWSFAITLVMRRNEGRERILSTIQFVGGVSTAWAITGFSIVWLTASFRAETRPAHDIMLLNDAGWMIFVMTFVPTVIQMAAFAIFILRDSRATPLYPRWLAYLTFWLAASLFAGFLMPTFQTGPFAWHGLITFYVGLNAFFAWAGFASWYTFRAIRRIESEEAATPGAA